MIATLLFIFLIPKLSFSQTTYDYIVVGGGTAGCVVATRLSENPLTKVLLIEAGREPSPITNTVTFLTLNVLSDQNFHYFAEKESGGLQGLIGTYWPRGKMFGGTSSLNGALFIRANRNNLNKWVDEGAEGWSWEDILPFYKKIEKYLIPNNVPELHGNNGPIPITTLGDKDSVCREFVASAQQLGHQYRDPNDGYQTGVSYTPVNVYNNIRQTSYTNYLKPVIAQRKNLVVEKNAFAERLVFDNNKRVTAVVYSQNGQQITAFVNKEVILCAGVINTPQLLMLSGVGPREHLMSKGIDVVMDLPVGKNLKDHFGVLEIHEFRATHLTDPIYYGSCNAFYPSQFESNSLNPDIQLMLFAYSMFYITVTVLSRPESKGYIELRSKDPYEKPKIVPRHLTVENDVDRLADGVRRAAEIFKKMKLSSCDTGECKNFNTSSLDYWKCIVKAKGSTFFHPVGTCKMGPRNSNDSVVDNKLKVIGLQNVRVADASVFPDQISGNPVATILSIAERVVEFIKNNE